MKKYKNLSGNSGVITYAAGAANIAHMHKLATTGQGLCTFITQSVREKYKRKWQ
jgi:hypothetical protein